MKEVRGFGVGFRPPHYESILKDLPPNLDWLEVISENFMSQAPGPKRVLERARQNYPMALHGVSLSIGSPEPLDRNYLKLLEELVNWLEPGIVSDHLCWSQFEKQSSHDLLPMPYTKETLEIVADKVDELQSCLKRQILLENPSAYVEFKNNDFMESDFLKELCLRTGCGILLDLNNLFVNFKNLGVDPINYIRTLPLDSVRQFHLAGHSQKDQTLIDTHDHPVCEEVWQLFEFASKRWSQVPTLVEWDEKIPDLKSLLNEVNKARKRHGQERVFTRCVKPLTQESSSLKMDLGKTLSDFFKVATELSPLPPQRLTFLNSDTGMSVYKDAYFLRLEGILKEIYPGLFYILEETGFRELTIAYIAAYPPFHYSVTYCGSKLPEFLDKQKFEFDFGVPQECLRDLALLEWTRTEVYDRVASLKPVTRDQLTALKSESWEDIGFDLINTQQILNLDWDIGPAWESAYSQAAPPKPEQQSCEYLVFQKNGDVTHLKLTKEEFNFLQNLQQRSFKEACHALEGDTSKAERGLSLLLKFVDRNLVVFKS